jgi:hypothetical protein
MEASPPLNGSGLDETGHTLALTSVRKIIEPLMRWALAQGLQYEQIDDVVRTSIVSAAKAAGASTASALHVATGLNRKDISKRLNAPPGGEPLKQSLLMQIHSTWMGVAPWADESIRPRALQRLRRDGGEQSFEALVEHVGKNVRPRAVLDEMLARSLVELDPLRDLVSLKPVEVGFGKSNEAMLMALTVGTLTEIMAKNYTTEQRDLSIVVWADKVAHGDIAPFCQWAYPKFSALQMQLNAEISRLESKASALPDEACAPVTMGMYANAGGNFHALQEHKPAKLIT